MARRKKRDLSRRDFYSKPAPVRIGTRIFEGLLSTGAVYLLSPQLISLLAPLQASINASAAQAGQPVSNVGTAKVANAINLVTQT